MIEEKIVKAYVDVAIRIDIRTLYRLKKFGSMDSTYDSVLNDLMDHADD